MAAVETQGLSQRFGDLAVNDARISPVESGSTWLIESGYELEGAS